MLVEAFLAQGFRFAGCIAILVPWDRYREISYGLGGTDGGGLDRSATEGCCDLRLEGWVKMARYLCGDVACDWRDLGEDWWPHHEGREQLRSS